MTTNPIIWTIRNQLRSNQDILDNVPFWVSNRHDKLQVGAYMANPEKMTKLKTELEKHGYKCNWSISEKWTINISQ